MIRDILLGVVIGIIISCAISSPSHRYAAPEIPGYGAHLAGW